MDKNILPAFPRAFISAREPGSEKKAGYEPRWTSCGSVGMSAVHSADPTETVQTAGNVPDRVLDLRAVWLSAAPLFRGLSVAECSEIARAATEKRFSRKQIIFAENDPVRCMFVITNGRVKITQLSSTGKEVILRVDGPHAMADGVGTLSPVHTTTAHAMDPCRVLAWEVGVADALAKRYPAITRNALTIMAQRLKKLEERYCDLSTALVPQRLARVLLELAGQFSGPGSLTPVGLSREELAQMTGTTLFTVSRLLRDWAIHEIVQVDRKSIWIEQLPRLIQLADDATGPEAARLYQ